MITDEDRKVLARLLAKCIACFNCGRTEDAALLRGALDAQLELCGVPSAGAVLAARVKAEEQGCDCDNRGKGQYHLPGCPLYVQPRGPRNNCGEGA